MTSIAGSDGRPEARPRTAGGDTTLMMKALCTTTDGVVTAAEKRRWVESGSHIGLPMSVPVVNVVNAAAPVRPRMRRLTVVRSWRRYAIRLPAGAQATSLTGAESVTSK